MSAVRLWVDGSEFGRERLLGGAAVPWAEPAAAAAYLLRLDELLDTGLVALPLADWLDAWPAPAPERPRPAAALKAALAADAPLEALTAIIDAVGDRRPVGLEIPSPAAWAARVGTDEPTDEVGERAATYVASFLRRLGERPVSALLVGDEAGVPVEVLAPIVRVAEHYRWLVGVHGDAGPAHFTVTHVRIPADAAPELVLEQMSALRQGAS